MGIPFDGKVASFRRKSQFNQGQTRCAAVSLRHVERPRYHRIHRRKYDNEALLALDILVAAAVEDVPANDPPQSPALGDCYLVGNTPSGEWSQFPGHIAAFGGGGWRFIAPREGMAVLVKASGLIAAYRAGTWEIGIARASRLVVDGLQVVGAQTAAIPDPTGGTTVDAEARAAVSEMLAALRQHGLISA